MGGSLLGVQWPNFLAPSLVLAGNPMSNIFRREGSGLYMFPRFMLHSTPKH